MKLNFPIVHRPPQDIWVWSVPSVATLAMLIIYLSDSNQAIFLLINQQAQLLDDGVWSHLTLLGDSLIPACLAILLLKSRADIVWSLLLAAIFGTLFVHGFKPLFDIPRPAAVLPPDALHIIGRTLRHHAFPSGHTTTIFTLVGVIILQTRHCGLNIILFLLAITVGISRCAVGAHWILDVLAGAAGGWSVAWLGILWARHWQWQEKYAIWAALFFSINIMYLWSISLDYPHTWLFQKVLATTCTFSAIQFWLTFLNYDSKTVA